jgi:hypothetical protein
MTAKKFVKAIVKTISITAAAGALAVMAGGCHWEYDPTGEWNSGGGELVGDWIIMYERHSDGEIEYPTANGKTIYSFKSSGKFFYGGFGKVGDVWIALELWTWVDEWYTIGQKLYLCSHDYGYIDVKQYTISGNTLTLNSCYYDDWNGKIADYCYEAKFTKVNIADVRKSLGTVYTADSKLQGEWRLQGDNHEHIYFYMLSYGNYDGDIRYINAKSGYHYTIGNKLYLIGEECEWYDDDNYQCKITETVELTYSITGTGDNRTLKINNDTWIFVPYDDDDYYYSQAKSSQVNFKIRPSPPPPFGHLLGKR